MSRKTLRDAKESRIPLVLGVDPDSDQFLSYINEAQDRIIKRGNFRGGYQNVRFCLTNGCLTLPRQIIALSAVKECGRVASVYNQWEPFVPGGEECDFISGLYCGCPGPKWVDKGFYPTFYDIDGTHKKVRFYPRATSDVGKRILLQGYNDSKEWIRTEDAGLMIDGMYLTLAEDYVETSIIISSITGLQKVDTDADVLIYEVNTLTGGMKQLGKMEPDERVASYRRYYNREFDDTCGLRTVSAIAKLDFIPVRVDSDYLFVDDIPALKEMCQSIRFSEMDAPQAKQEAVFHRKEAMIELNQQKQNENNDDSIKIRMRTQGSASLRRSNVGPLT